MGSPGLASGGTAIAVLSSLTFPAHLAPIPQPQWSLGVQTREADHAQRCVIAHYLADLEPDLEAEVLWDELALADYAHVSDGDLAPVGIAAVRGMAPSLHLNLGDGYLRQGRLAEARAQLVAGRAHQDALGADGYGALIRNGLTALSARIEAADEAIVN